MTHLTAPDLADHSVDLEQRYRLSILADLTDKSLVLTNLDAVARSLRPRPGISPLLDADRMDRFLRYLHHRWQADYSFGGYVEDRRELWRGSYLDENSAVHLGNDVNVPAGTRLTVAQPATLVHHVHDTCQDGGWGGVLMFRLAQPIGTITHFLYAHLKNEAPRLPIGSHVQPGDVVAVLGEAHENGGWYEHLHVQALTQAAWDRTQGDLAKFDGYAPVQYATGHPDFPDPWPLLGAVRF